MEADAPKEVDTTLPGWVCGVWLYDIATHFQQGSWGGSGITKPPPKPERIKRFPGVDPKKRQDYQKDHVIISEKKDKKAEKYLVKDLPFPYTSKAQFERRLEVPLGMEWNTRATFQKATLPRVVKKVYFFSLLTICTDCHSDGERHRAFGTPVLIFRCLLICCLLLFVRDLYLE